MVKHIMLKSENSIKFFIVSKSRYQSNLQKEVSDEEFTEFLLKNYERGDINGI
jgi:hypothetical protein